MTHCASPKTEVGVQGKIKPPGQSAERNWNKDTRRGEWAAFREVRLGLHPDSTGKKEEKRKGRKGGRERGESEEGK